MIKKQISGIPFGLYRKIISLYADDILIYFNKLRDISVLRSILINYSNFSGLFINETKCHVIQFGSTNWNTAPFHSTNNTTYLGFNISANGATVDWDNTLTLAAKSLSFWKKLPLGLFGKVNFFKMYALSLFRYYLPICKLAENTSKNVDNLLYWFLFNNSSTFTQTKQYHHIIARTRLAAHWKKGGLNIPTLTTISDISKASWIPRSWNQHTTFWSKAIYSELHTTITHLRINAHPLISKKDHTKSIKINTIKIITKAWRTFEPNGCWTTPNSNISIIDLDTELTKHKGRTISSNSNSTIYKKEYNLLKNNEELTNKHIQPTTVNAETLKLCPPILTNASNHDSIEAYLKALKSRNLLELKIMDPPLTNMQVKWQEMYELNWKKIWKTIKKLKVRPGIKGFSWKLYHNSLPVLTNLHTNTTKCAFCDEEETVTHLFINCNYTKQIANQISKWWPEIPLTAFFLPGTILHQEIIAIFRFTIWKQRCSILIDNNTLPINNVTILTFKLEIQRFLNAINEASIKKREERKLPPIITQDENNKLKCNWQDIPN